MTSPVSTAAIYSLGSPDGSRLYISRAGREPWEYGQRACPASRSRLLAEDSGPPTGATYGPLFNLSSPSYDLQQSLENRLRALLDEDGSPEFDLIWKHWDMPWGLPICRLAASARLTADIDFFSWPTPTTQDNPQTSGQYGGKTGTTLAGAARAAPWPTPLTRAGKYRLQSDPDKALERMTNPERSNDLDDAAHLPIGPWPSPTTSTGGAEPEGATGRKLVAIAGWMTPKASDGESNSRKTKNRPVEKSTHLPTQARVATGTMGSGSCAPTEKLAVLNPELCRWLMGYPPVWSSWIGTAPRTSSEAGTSPATATP